jgi:signal transduction histidine kinase
VTPCLAEGGKTVAAVGPGLETPQGCQCELLGSVAYYFAMEAPSLTRRLAYLDFAEEDAICLRRLQPLLEAHADGLVAAFYRHLLGFDETRSLLRDPEVKTRLLDKQRSYLLGLAEPSIDERYVHARVQIGQTHVRVGLAPAWYLGAYGLYMRLLVPLISEHFRAQPGVSDRTILALHKLLILDAELAMEAYIERREEQLEFLNRELAQAGRQMNEVYARQTDELRETSARAHAAEELASIATLVAGLAHEIGTPMNVIQGHAERLETAVSDERSRWRLRTIRDQIERITSIIQSLLSMARPKAREQLPVDLTRVLEQALAFLTEKFRSRRINAKIDSHLHPIVVGDGEKLQQVFLNLFINAADAMPDGGELRVEVLAAGEGRTRVNVADTGHGIPEAVLGRIFEPFFTTKEGGRGNGLGLMVAAGIVREHDGKIEVQSEVGRGTTFFIDLPYSQIETTPRVGAGD